MLAIIGGSGLYQLDGARSVRREKVTTPFGDPSSEVTVVECGAAEALFLARHGDHHQLLPSEINYRANIWALKKMGARQLISVSAVGSLREEIAPGDFVLPTQYGDMTKGIRERTFFGDGLIGHVSTALPVCPNLTEALSRVLQQLAFNAHRDANYVCVEGPRLGTKLESFFLRDAWGADVVGMTNVPEVFLAREAQLCYATLGVCTDYDCWKDDSASHVTVADVIEKFGHSIGRAKQVITTLLAAAPPPIDEDYRQSLAMAVLTPESAMSEAHRQLLSVLRA